MNEHDRNMQMQLKSSVDFGFRMLFLHLMKRTTNGVTVRSVVVIAVCSLILYFQSFFLIS